MSPIQFVEIGTIQRTHGINGELQVQWSSEFDLSENFPESVFIEIDGIPVPFFIISHRAKGFDKVIVRLEDIDDVETASTLENLKILLPKTDIVEIRDLLLEDLIGFTLLNEQKEIIGKISDLQEYQSNPVFTVIHSSNAELLIPAAEDLIVEVNEATQTVVMHIPDGLLELYLE